MKTTVLILVSSVAAALSLRAASTNVLSDENSRVSYAIGMMTGHQWKQQDIGFNPDIYARGIKDEMSGGTTLLTQEEAQQTIESFRKEFAAKQQKTREEATVKNKTEGEAFLAANKDKPGVKTMADGLQYRVITEGSGSVPTVADTVSVNYSGKLLDGTEFDSSYKRGQPAQFPVTGVIKGWTEALLQMKVGSKWELYIPSDLAYGPQGRPGIPPNSVLVFQIELLSTQTPPAAQPATPASPPLTSDIIKVPSAEEMKKGAKIEVIKPEDVQKAQPQQK